MVKRSKILAKVQSGSKNIRFTEFQALLEGYGFVLDRITGSHHIYIHNLVPERLPAVPNKDGSAKPYQIRQLLKYVQDYELELED